MGRPERPLDACGGPIAAFAHDLRALRNHAGNPSYRELARTALFAPSVLSSAASGYRLPTLPVTLGFVTACGGDAEAWERRWRSVAAGLEAADPRRAPGTAAPAAAVVPAAPVALPGAAQAAPEPPPAPPAGALSPPAAPFAAAPAAGAFGGHAPPAQLPYHGDVFVGHRQELADAAFFVKAGRARRDPIVVCGPVGVGKSAFALRLADEVGFGFPDGQLYADLGALPPGEHALATVVDGFLRALDVPAPMIPQESEQKLGMFRSLLTQRRLFVLLENVRDEHQILPFLARTAHSQVVVTGRPRMLALEGVHRIELAALARQESLALLGLLAGTERVRAEYRASDAVAEACADLPLAVDIAGRRIAARPEWSITHAARLLTDHSRLLDELAVGAVNMRDRFASAYERLSEDEQRALRSVRGVGAGWVTASDLAGAMGVSPDRADRLLDNLVDTGLLARASLPGHFSVSVLVEMFAAETGQTRAPKPAPRPHGADAVRSSQVIAGARRTPGVPPAGQSPRLIVRTRDASGQSRTAID